ncbi:MAG: heme o synthase, partial [Bacteriovoracaceae bacterium]
KILYVSILVLTFVQLLVGAQLQDLKVNLICPDWPRCYGQFTSHLLSPAHYEQIRFWSNFLTGVLAVMWGFLSFKKKGVKGFLVVFFLVLNSLTTWAITNYKLPTTTLLLQFIFLLLLLATLESTKDIKFEASLKEKWNPRIKDYVGTYLFFIVFQIVLGSILRKSSLLAACESSESFLSCWQKQAEIPLAGNLSILHRGLGLLLALTGPFLFGFLIKNLPKWKGAAWIGMILIFLQLTLGLMMGRSSSQMMIIYHFGLSIFLFYVLTFLLVRLRRAEWNLYGSPVATYLNDTLDLFKPKLTILVVITVLIGVFIAPGQVNIIYLLISLVAIWLQAAGSLALNSYLEREEDKHMERTKNRPLPSGRLKPYVALNWGWGLIVIGTVFLIVFSNLLTASLGLLAALSYIYVYTPMKQTTPYALYVGSLPGALPTLMGWTCMTNSLTGIGPYLFSVLFIWQIPHFMAISLYRKQEYASAQFRTFAQTHSVSFLKWNIFFYSLIMLLVGLLPWFWGWRGQGYYYSSIALGVILSGWAVLGLKNFQERDLSQWARGYFWLTLLYLPLQLGVLLVLR